MVIETLSAGIYPWYFFQKFSFYYVHKEITSRSTSIFLSEWAPSLRNGSKMDCKLLLNLFLPSIHLTNAVWSKSKPLTFSGHSPELDMGWVQSKRLISRNFQVQTSSIESLDSDVKLLTLRNKYCKYGMVQSIFHCELLKDLAQKRSMVNIYWIGFFKQRHL